jgi:hypothetical protein
MILTKIQILLGFSKKEDENFARRYPKVSKLYPSNCWLNLVLDFKCFVVKKCTSLQ